MLRIIALFGAALMMVSCDGQQVVAEIDLGISQFEPEVLSSSTSDENLISFTDDEQLAFFTRSENWEDQIPFLSRKVDGTYLPPQKVKGLDTIYNGAISPEGDRLVYTIREGDATSSWVATLRGDSVSSRINLTDESGIRAGYFFWEDSTRLAFYVPEREGDVVLGLLEEERLVVTDTLPALNTELGTEFSPCVDADRRFLVFSRYLDGDPEQQGFFVSYNEGTATDPVWTMPERLESLPYGWGARVLYRDRLFVYTDGVDLFQVPLDSIGLRN